MNKKLGIEIIAVLLITVGRSIANNLAAIYWVGSPPIRPFGYFHFTECLRGLYLGGLVLFVVWLKKESWTELGLRTPFWIKDVVVALFLIFVVMLIWIPFASLIDMFGFLVLQKPPTPFEPPTAVGQWLWVCITAIVVGFGEELLMRGYLLSRLLRVYRPTTSVIISSLVFSAWHMSHSLFSGAHTFIWGLVYGWTFAKIRRLYPLALAHAINNMIVFLWA